MTRHESTIPVSLLRRLLSLDEEEGRLYWKQRPVEFFQEGRQPASTTCASWNAKCAGKEALAHKQGAGYLHGCLMGEKVLAHRAAYALTHGAWPDGEVDHINGIKTDNRPSNLRSASHADNMRNQRLRSTNTSGFNGVSFDKARGKYHAYIYADGRNAYLGRFDTAEAANEARQLASAEHGYHCNHGREAS